MLKVKRMENFFMIQCKCYNFANFLAFKDRFLETDCKDTFFCSLSLCCLYIINRNNVEFNAFFCVQRQVISSNICIPAFKSSILQAFAFAIWWYISLISNSLSSVSTNSASIGVICTLAALKCSPYDKAQPALSACAASSGFPLKPWMIQSCVGFHFFFKAKSSLK